MCSPTICQNITEIALRESMQKSGLKCPNLSLRSHYQRLTSNATKGQKLGTPTDESLVPSSVPELDHGSHHKKCFGPPARPVWIMDPL